MKQRGSGRLCPVCSKGLEPGRDFCRDCWRLVPSDLQRHVLTAWRVCKRAYQERRRLEISREQYDAIVLRHQQLKDHAIAAVGHALAAAG